MNPKNKSAISLSSKNCIPTTSDTGSKLKNLPLNIDKLIKELEKYVQNLLKNLPAAQDQATMKLHAQLKCFEFFRTFPSSLISSTHPNSNLITRLKLQIKVLERLNELLLSQSEKNINDIIRNPNVMKALGIEASDILIKTFTDLENLEQLTEDILKKK